MKLQLLGSLALYLVAGQAQETCDAPCQAAFKQALMIESSAWISQNASTDPFYQTPANVSGAKPGDVLRWEDVSRENVNTKFMPPAGMSLSRFLYMTEDLDGKPIPASAFVLLPYSKPDPNKPFDTLVWTHGTAGRIRNCAPSNNKDLYYDWQGPHILAQVGYAVIAPDYAGLGSDIPQGSMYEGGYVHAADVAYSLIAARKVIGDLLSEEWVVVGHSEGGLTAWRTNERLAKPGQEGLLKAGKFLGAVANSPALRPLDLVPESIRRANGGPIGDAVSVLFLQSLELLYPKTFRVRDWATDLVVGRLPLMDQGCLQVGRALFANLTSEQLFRNTSWLQHPSVVDWQKTYNGAGPYKLAGPMLVTQGINDILTYANNTQYDYHLTCTAFPDTRADLLLYPESDHNVNAQVAQYDFLKWIKERFEGKAVETGCRTRTVVPVNNRTRSVGTFWSGVSG